MAECLDDKISTPPGGIADTLPGVTSPPVTAIPHDHEGPHLLTLPTEIRRMILFQAIKLIPSRDGGRYNGDLVQWFEPDVLRVCRQLRIEGLIEYMDIRLVFPIKNYDVRRAVKHRLWQKKVMEAYNIRFCARAFLSVVEPQNPKQLDLSNNLGFWMKQFYTNNFTALFLERDWEKFGLSSQTRHQKVHGFCFPETVETYVRQGYAHLSFGEILNLNTCRRLSKMFMVARRCKKAGLDWNTAKRIIADSVDCANLFKGQICKWKSL